jgi:hypothetical protein
MYTRIGILGRARQAIGIARLHALREALYIDVKYNAIEVIKAGAGAHTGDGEVNIVPSGFPDVCLAQRNTSNVRC